jgi:hypothetical protein
MKSNKIVKVHHDYTITEGDMELAKYKFFLEQGLNMLYDVSFRYIDYKSNKSMLTTEIVTRKELRNRLKHELDKIVEVVWKEDDGYPANWVKDFNGLVLLEYLDEPHSGDCTKDCWSCSRCYIERIIGCETNVDNTKYIPEDEL